MIDTHIDTEWNMLTDGDAHTLTPARLAKQRAEVAARERIAESTSESPIPGFLNAEALLNQLD